MSNLISGALVMGYAIAALFFLSFHRRTRDRLFLLFSAAFFLLAVQRGALALLASESSAEIALYVLRLAAFLLILVAIFDKNRARA